MGSKKRKRGRYSIKMESKFLRKGDQIELHGQRITVPEDGWYTVQADIEAELPPSAESRDEREPGVGRVLTEEEAEQVRSNRWTTSDELDGLPIGRVLTEEEAEQCKGGLARLSSRLVLPG